MRLGLGALPGVRRARHATMWLAGNVARWGGLLGINYHRIGDGRRSLFDRGLYSATAEEFDRQIRWLKARFDVVSPSDIPRVLETPRGRHVIVSFDDGYADNYTAAFPVLRDNAVPATFFVATGYVDRPAVPWWDEIAWMVRASKKTSLAVAGFAGFADAPIAFDEPDRERAVRALLRIYKKLPAERTGAFVDAIADAAGTGRLPNAAEEAARLWMTWDMLREMHASGMTIGGHTMTHGILSRMARDEQRREIAGCAARIEAEIGARPTAFAYPVGARDAFDADTRECLREAGFTSAFSYYGGFRTKKVWDDYDIRRIAIEQDTTFAEFRAAVSFPWTRDSFARR